MPIAEARCSRTTTSISSRKARTGGSTRSSGVGCAKAAPISACGRRMHGGSPWSANSTAGTGARIRSRRAATAPESGKASCPTSRAATATSFTSSQAGTATRSTRPTRSPSTPRCRRRQPRALGRSSTAGRTASGWRPGAPRTRSTRRFRSTRCISGPGVAATATAISTTARPPISSPSTSAARGSPTSSCCRSPSIRSTARGAIRRRATSHRPRATARRRTSCTSSTSCTRTASA